MLKKTLLLFATLLLMVAPSQVHAGDDPLLFSAEEMAHAYRYQQQLGARLRHPLKPEECWYDKKEFTASFQGRKFSAPCKFVTETTRHLREAREWGVVRYLFPLDAYHANLGVPLEVWQRKYKDLPTEQLLPAFLKEPTLAAWYQTSGYVDPERVGHATVPALWGANRTIMGFYDKRPIDIFPPSFPGSVVYQPKEYRWIDGFIFLAHSLGDLQLFAKGKVMMFDISFDSDRAGEFPSNAVNVSTRSR